MIDSINFDELDINMKDTITANKAKALLLPEETIANLTKVIY
jgi:hypothetical protein